LEDLCSSLLSHLQTFLYFPIVLDFRKFFVCGYYYFVYPSPSETVRGSNFYDSWLFLLWFTLYPFVTKKVSNFYFWTGNVFPNRSSDFCPRMAKEGVC